ncbi:DUF4844 domain-containing protein [Winogradskyella sp. 4-2091]|uniref:DUF4844 domain-containing protein n=1 Tax=Winogradskyella sp. 4-2091 TaxID=3381659 RepID=UPI0038916A97
MKFFKSTLILLFTLGVTISYAQETIQMQTPVNANKLFKAFIAKEKFINENTYPGISDEKLKPILTEKINEVAVEFKNVSEFKELTNIDYLKVIKNGLSKFPELELGFDSEDRERICLYFEELMDIVNLESSNGLINKFYYGFAPNDFIKQD